MDSRLGMWAVPGYMISNHACPGLVSETVSATKPKEGIWLQVLVLTKAQL